MQVPAKPVSLMRPLPMLALAAAVLAAAAGFWVLRNFDPAAPGSLFPQCLFRLFTGWYCISCGLTRALHALAHGDVLRAFSMNPLAMALLAISPLLGAWKLGWKPGVMAPVVTVLAEPKLWLVVLPGYWVVRNLPWFPFTLLAPG